MIGLKKIRDRQYNRIGLGFIREAVGDYIGDMEKEKRLKEKKERSMKQGCFLESWQRKIKAGMVFQRSINGETN